MKKKVLLALLASAMIITNIPAVSYAMEDSGQYTEETEAVSTEEEEETSGLTNSDAENDNDAEEQLSYDETSDQKNSDEKEAEKSSAQIKDAQINAQPNQQAAEASDDVTAENNTVSNAVKTGFAEEEEGIRYYTSNGQPAVGEQVINGFFYIFDQNGYLKLGLQKNSQGKSYCYITEAPYLILASGQKIGDDWYYFDESGIMFPGGWRYDGDKTDRKSTRGLSPD